MMECRFLCVFVCIAWAAFGVRATDANEVTCEKYPDADAVLVDDVSRIAYNPDGTYVEGDYPYLTYNDLYDLRKYLSSSERSELETLTYLMGEKLQWMQNNGVTGYEKG